MDKQKDINFDVIHTKDGDTKIIEFNNKEEDDMEQIDKKIAIVEDNALEFATKETSIFVSAVFKVKNQEGSTVDTSVKKTYAGLSIGQEILRQSKVIMDRYKADEISISKVFITRVNQSWTAEDRELYENILAFNAGDVGLNKFSKMSLTLNMEGETYSFMCIYETYMILRMVYGYEGEEWKTELCKSINKKTQKKRNNYIVDKFNKEEEKVKRMIKEGKLISFIDYVNEKNPLFFGVYLTFKDEYYPNDKCELLSIYKDKHVAPSSFELIQQYRIQVKGKSGREWRFKLDPIEKSKILQSENHFSWDIEAVKKNNKGDNIPIALCVYNKKRNVEKRFTGVSCIIDFIKWIEENYMDKTIQKGNRKKKKTKFYFWAHNGSRYDNIYLVRPLLNRRFDIDYRGTELNMKSIVVFNINFMDFNCIFTGKLDNLGKMFLGRGKQEFVIESITKEDYTDYLEDIVNYCMKDCILLYDLIMLYFDMMSKIKVKGDSLKEVLAISAASLSVKIFRRHFLEEVLYSSDTYTQDAERSSYKGGIVVALKERLSNGYSYDINSSYPYAMLKPMPVKVKSKGQYVNPLSMNTFNSLTLYKVVFTFNKNILFCNLPIRSSEGLTYPHNILESEWFWGCELQIASKVGCEIKVYEFIQYEGEPIFKDYIETMYGERLKAKKLSKDYEKCLKNCEKGSDKEKELIMLKQEQDFLIEYFKLLMNSLYGKFGQQKYDKQIIGHMQRIKELISDSNVSLISVSLMNDLDVKEELPIYKVNYHTCHYETESIGSLCKFSSYITALSRCTLVSAMYAVGIENVSYVDTDSIHTTKQLPERFLEKDMELGKFKLEYRIKRGIYCGSKIYMEEKYEEDWQHKDKFEENGKPKQFPGYIMKAKGIRKGQMTPNDYEEMLKKKSLKKINSPHFKVRFGCVTVSEQVRYIKMTETRRFDDNGNSKTLEKWEKETIRSTKIEKKNVLFEIGFTVPYINTIYDIKCGNNCRLLERRKQYIEGRIKETIREKPYEIRKEIIMASIRKKQKQLYDQLMMELKAINLMGNKKN